MEDLIIGSDGWLGKILVVIIDHVGDLNSTDLILNNVLPSVVFER